MYFPLVSKWNWAVIQACNIDPSEKITRGCNNGPSIASNFCCVETERRKLHTPPTSMVMFLRFNIAETILAQPLPYPLLPSPTRRWKPSTAEAQLGNSSCSGTSMRRKPRAGVETRSPVCWKLGQWKQMAESSCGSFSDSRRPLVKVGSPCSYGWKDRSLT